MHRETCFRPTAPTLVQTCLVEDLVHDVAVVREVVFPRENDGRDFDQKALCASTDGGRGVENGMLTLDVLHADTKVEVSGAWS